MLPGIFRPGQTRGAAPVSCGYRSSKQRRRGGKDHATLPDKGSKGRLALLRLAHSPIKGCSLAAPRHPALGIFAFPSLYFSDSLQRKSCAPRPQFSPILVRNSAFGQYRQIGTLGESCPTIIFRRWRLVGCLWDGAKSRVPSSASDSTCSVAPPRRGGPLIGLRHPAPRIRAGIRRQSPALRKRGLVNNSRQPPFRRCR